MKKLWGGRFQKTPEKWVDEFGASITFDQNLVKEDITAVISSLTKFWSNVMDAPNSSTHFSGVF